MLRVEAARQLSAEDLVLLLQQQGPDIACRKTKTRLLVTRCW